MSVRGTPELKWIRLWLAPCRVPAGTRPSVLLHTAAVPGVFHLPTAIIISTPHQRTSPVPKGGCGYCCRLRYTITGDIPVCIHIHKTAAAVQQQYNSTAELVSGVGSETNVTFDEQIRYIVCCTLKSKSMT